MTLQLLNSEFPYIYEENFYFIFISAVDVDDSTNDERVTAKAMKKIMTKDDMIIAIMML
jgi:hypothetical protein